MLRLQDFLSIVKRFDLLPLQADGLDDMAVAVIVSEVEDGQPLGGGQDFKLVTFDGGEDPRFDVRYHGCSVVDKL